MQFGRIVRLKLCSNWDFNTWNCMQRNYSVDILKLVCAFLVIMLHCSQPPYNIVGPISLCAVPCFFMISGYFLWNDNPEKMRNRLLKSLKKIIWIWLWTSIVCGLDDVYKIIVNKDLSLCSLQNLLNFFVLNEHPFAFHLWYINAYIYVLIVIYLLSKKKQLKFTFVITPILLLLTPLLSKYSLLLFQWKCPELYTRNFLSVGIPYFTLGMMVRKYLEPDKFKKGCVLFGLIISILILELENYFLDSLGRGNLYIFTPVVCLFLLATALVFQVKHSNIISRIGERDSLYIYVFHPLPIKLFRSGILNCYAIESFIVFFLTLTGIIFFRKSIYILKKVSLL